MTSTQTEFLLYGRHLGVAGALMLLIAASPLCEASESIETYMFEQDVPRKALVIGNRIYKFADPATNADADAEAIETTLAGLGAKVEKVINVERKPLLDKIDAFAGRLAAGDVAIVYFAGHGIQHSGNNYLVPVDAENSQVNRVGVDNVSLTYLLDVLTEKTPGVVIIILDACRKNPFAGLRGARGIPDEGGLAQIKPPVGALVAFATGPGRTAWSEVAAEPSKNSLYTRSLIYWLPQKGYPIEKVFKRIRYHVFQLSQKNQDPWEETSLLGDFSFAPTEEDRDREAKDWRRILEMKSRDDAEMFIRINPASRYVAAARKWLKDTAQASNLASVKVFSSASIGGSLRGLQNQLKDDPISPMVLAVANARVGVYSAPTRDAEFLGYLEAGESVAVRPIDKGQDWACSESFRFFGKRICIPNVRVEAKATSSRPIQTFAVVGDEKALTESAEKKLKTALQKYGANEDLFAQISADTSGDESSARARSLAFSRSLIVKHAMLQKGFKAENVAIDLVGASKTMAAAGGPKGLGITIERPFGGRM